MPAVEISSDAKPGLGLSGAGIVEDLLVRIQWFAIPVSRDFREEAMLDGIPLRSAGGIVSHGYGQGEGVGQLQLNFSFPGITAATVTAAGIGENEQLASTAITGGTFLLPPISDGMSGKGGSVVGNADDQSCAIFRNIVNPIGDSDPDRIGAEVVIIDATRSRFPTLTRIFEIPDEFAFLGVYA